MREVTGAKMPEWGMPRRTVSGPGVPGPEVPRPAARRPEARIRLVRHGGLWIRWVGERGRAADGRASHSRRERRARCAIRRDGRDLDGGVEDRGHGGVPQRGHRAGPCITRRRARSGPTGQPGAFVRGRAQGDLVAGIRKSEAAVPWSTAGNAVAADRAPLGWGDDERGDRPSGQIPVHPVSVDGTLDAGDVPRRGPLPHRVAVVRPAVAGDVGGADIPVRDPQRMPTVPEPRGVAHEPAPEVVAGVDHRADARPRMDTIQPCLRPDPELLGREPTRLLDVEDGQNVSRPHSRDSQEVVGLAARVPKPERGLREVVGPDDEAVRGRTRDVLRVPLVPVPVPERRAHDHEADGRRGDRRPLDPPLVLRNVDTRYSGSGDRGHCGGDCEHRCHRGGHDEDDMPPASRDPPHGYPPPRSPVPTRRGADDNPRSRPCWGCCRPNSGHT